MRKTLALKAAIPIALTLLAVSPRALGDDLVPPKLEKTVEPVYPPAKKASGEGATVSLLLTIDKTGKVTDVAVTQSAGEDFDAAAIEAARALEFKPATRDGVAIVAKIPYKIEFAVAAEAPSPPPPPPVPAETPKAPEPKAPITTAPSDEPVEIAVEGARPPRETTKHVLEGPEIRKVPGTGGDALRAIEALPGVARPPAMAGLLIVRGSAPRDTQVFVDGTWIPVAYHFGGITSVVPTEVLSKIDFYPGNFSSEFGRGLGGIVDIGIRSPRKDRLGGMAQVDVLDGRILAEGPLGPSTRFLVSARRSWVDAWIGPVLSSGGGQTVRTAPVYWDGQAVLEQDLGSRTTARLLFLGSDDRMALVMDAPVAGDPAFGGAFSQHIRFFRAQLRFDTRIDDDTRWINMVSYGQNAESVAIGDNRVETLLPLVNARSDVRTKLARGLTAVVGLDAMWVGYDVTINFPAIVGDDPVGPFFGRPTRQFHGEGGSLRPASYAMLDWSPTPGLKILPGVRLDYTPDTKKLDVDPRLAVRWDVVQGTPRTTLKGAAGVYHQTPLEESVQPWGDGKLKSNGAYHASAGFEQAFDEHVELSVEGFYKHFKDLIVQRADATKTVGVGYENSGSGRAYGLETLLRYKPGGRFFGWVAYTLSRSERREVPGQSMHLFQWDQTHILTALGSFDLGRGWSLGARFRYTSGTPYTPFTGGVVDLDAGAYEPIVGRPYASRTAPFHELSLRGEKTWTVGPMKLGAYLEVRNVYNRQNPEGVVYSYDYARSAPVAGLPILPVIGLRGEL